MLLEILDVGVTANIADDPNRMFVRQLFFIFDRLATEDERVALTLLFAPPKRKTRRSEKIGRAVLLDHFFSISFFVRRRSQQFVAVDLMKFGELTFQRFAQVKKQRVEMFGQFFAEKIFARFAFAREQNEFSRPGSRRHFAEQISSSAK